MKTKGILLTILSAVTFGFAFTLAPIIYGGGGNPVTLTLLRSFLCIPILFLTLKYKKIPLKISKRNLIYIVILGVIGSSTTALILNMSFAYIDVGIAMTIHFVYPVFVTLACIIFFKEKINLMKILALIICTMGILCFLGTGSDSSSNLLLGIVLAFVSGLTYAFYMIFLDKSGLKDIHPLVTAFYIAIVVSISILIYGLATNELSFLSLTPLSWLLTFIFAILCSIIAVSLLQIGVKYIGSSTAAVLGTFEPITSVIFGWLILGEELTLLKVIACLFIFAGVILLVLSKESTN